MGLAHEVREGQRTRDIQITRDVMFDSMLLSNTTLEGLKKSGFQKPSPIQLHGIPLGKCGFDLFLEAKSGTGKTAVFTVIALEQLDLNKGLQSIILAPTREIAAQISDVIKQIGSSFEGLNVEVVMGGLPVEEDIKKLQKNVHILVGSPGRTRHLIHDHHVDVSAARLLVLDEADKLMHNSFLADINYIFSALPKQKQVIMSSATYPDTLRTVMENYVHEAQHICPDSDSILLGIKQLVTTVESNINVVRQTQNKLKELLKILSKQEFKQCLIFCNYQVRVGELCKMLKREKWPVARLHGQLNQNYRLDALKTLQEYKCRILVSTDLAARGIDASNVDLVINFELPFDWQTYLHRIGRAGRFGSYGIAITILSKGTEQSKFRTLIKCINSTIDLNNLWSDNKFELHDSDSENPTLNNPKEIQEILNPPEEVGTLVKEKICKTRNENETTKVNEICGTSRVEICQTQRVVELGKSQKGEVICKAPELFEEQGNGISKMLLEILSFKKNESIEGVPQIDKIFGSLEKSKECEIESFNDLIASFKDHEPNNNENIDFRKYFDSMLNGKVEPDILLELHSDSDEEKHIGNGNVTAESFPSYNYEEKQICKNVLEKDIKQNESLCINDNLLQDKEDHLGLDCFQQALKDAGLPTAFGSTKYCYRPQGNVSNTTKSYERLANKQILNNNTHAECNASNECQQRRCRVLRKTNSKSSTKASPPSFDDDGYNTQSGLLSRSTKYIPPNMSSCSYLNDDSVQVNTDRYQKYLTWYRQLKTHVKQVEMSLFIDELSKP